MIFISKNRHRYANRIPINIPLAEAVSAIVTQERNGIYEIEVEYPVFGFWKDEIAIDGQILAKANPYQDPQVFDIYGVEYGDETIKIKGRHYWFRTAKIPVRNFGAVTPTTTMANTMARINECMIWTDGGSCFDEITGIGNSTTTDPQFVNERIAYAKDVILEACEYFNAHVVADNGNILAETELPASGIVANVILRDGLNITGIQYESDNEDAYNGVCPYYSNNNGITIANNIAPNDGGTDTRALLVDVTKEFEDSGEAVTVERLNQISAIRKDTVSANARADIVTIDTSFEGSDLITQKALEGLKIGDFVKIVHRIVGIDTIVRLVKYEFDPISERYTKMQFGKVDKGLAGEIIKGGGTSSGGSSGGGGSGVTTEQIEHWDKAYSVTQNMEQFSSQGFITYSSGYSNYSDREAASYFFIPRREGWNLVDYKIQHDSAYVTGISSRADSDNYTIFLNQNVTTGFNYTATWIPRGSSTSAQVIPTKLSDLTSDSTHRTVTDAQIATWNAGGSGGGADIQMTSATYSMTETAPYRMINGLAGYTLIGAYMDRADGLYINGFNKRSDNGTNKWILMFNQNATNGTSLTFKLIWVAN